MGRLRAVVERPYPDVDDEPPVEPPVEPPGALIAAVTYKTTALVELRQRVRGGAVAAARRKAEGYASAAGVRVGRLLHLEDVNPDNLSRRSHAPDVDLSADSDDAIAAGVLRVAGAVVASLAILAE